MIYINPIEILELKDKEVNEIDSSIIKKSKRRLFADIDLSDSGFYEYNGQKLTKSDCEKAIDELEDNEEMKTSVRNKKIKDLKIEKGIMN